MEFLGEEGVEAVHWSSIGDSRAPDAVIMAWARQNDLVVFTRFGFSTLLALTRGRGPSIVQVRHPDLLPESIGQEVLRVLRLCARELDEGAIVTIDRIGARLRILPIK